MVRLSELPQLLGTTPVRSELTYMLVTLDRDFTRQKPDDTWERYYARRLVEHFQPMPA